MTPDHDAADWRHKALLTKELPELQAFRANGAS